jgi:hypothetical protein
MYPSTDDIADPAGVLDDFEGAHARAVAITTPAGNLEPMITAVRRHFLSRRPTLTTSAVILEAPSFNPTLVTQGDFAVTPKSVSRTSLELD